MSVTLLIKTTDTSSHRLFCQTNMKSKSCLVSLPHLKLCRPLTGTWLTHTPLKARHSITCGAEQRLSTIPAANMESILPMTCSWISRMLVTRVTLTSPLGLQQSALQALRSSKTWSFRSSFAAAIHGAKTIASRLMAWSTPHFSLSCASLSLPWAASTLGRSIPSSNTFRTGRSTTTALTPICRSPTVKWISFQWPKTLS